MTKHCVLIGLWRSSSYIFGEIRFVYVLLLSFDDMVANFVQGQQTDQLASAMAEVAKDIWGPAFGMESFPCCSYHMGVGRGVG